MANGKNKPNAEDTEDAEGIAKKFSTADADRRGSERLFRHVMRETRNSMLILNRKGVHDRHGATIGGILWPKEGLRMTFFECSFDPRPST
jgi:hypothetical protein